MFSVLRGQIVEVKRKPDLLGRAVSATNYTHCAKFNLKILRITNYMEQARIRLIVQHANLSSCQQKSKASLRERSILYAYLCLVCLVYIFCMNMGLLDKSMPSVSEVQEKCDRMKIFK